MYSRSNLRDNANNTTLELQRDLAQSTPEQCVTLTHSVPSVQMYYALKSKLESCTDKWLAEFLDLNGLDSLLNALDQMSGRGFTCFTDAILQMDCISCIRCVLNTSIGLEYFISSDVYTKKLTMVLSGSDALPKKQVFEILSAVCVYSHIGYLRVMEGLSYVKSECDQLHRFSLVLNDLRRSETAAHKTASMTFVNAVINCTPDVTERLRIRNEFIGLNLLDVLMFLRKEEPDENLILQLEIFHERKVADEESINTCYNIDYNSPQDLLDQIQSRVFGTSRMVNFVNILQDLLAIETVYNENHSKIWQTVDGLIHHVVHMSSVETSGNLKSELQRLPDQITQALDSLYDYNQVCDNQIHPGEECSGQPQPECSKYTADSKLCVDAKTGCTVHKEQRFTSKLYTNVMNDSKLSADFTYMDSCSNCNSGTLLDSQGSVNNATVVVRPTLASPACDITYFVNDMNSTGSERMTDASPSSSHNGIRMTSGWQELSDEENMNGTNYNTSAGKTSRYDQEKISNKLNIMCDETEDKPFCLELDNCGRKVPAVSNCLEIANSGRMIPAVKNCLEVNDSGRKMPVLKNCLEINDCGRKVPVVTNCLEIDDSGRKVPVVKNCLEIDDCGRKIVKKTNLVKKPVLPSPHKDMRELKWISLPDEYIVDRGSCVWLYPLYKDQQVQITFDKLETLFQVTSPGNFETVEEVVLLDATARLKINLFLNRLDSGAEDLVQNIQDGNKQQLTLPMLQYLNSIIPSAEEIVMLQQNERPRLELGMAEQFVLLLAEIPDYRLLLQAFLVQAEFDSCILKFKLSLTSMITLARLVLDSVDLRVMLHTILVVGNFLNHDKFNGDVAGFHLSTLQRLTEVKSTAPCKNLLHYLVQMVIQERPSILTFVKEVLSLENTTSCSMEDLKTDISKLNGKLRFVVTSLAKTDEKIRSMFQPFIESLRKDFSIIQSSTTELRALTDHLANYFCEDEESFDLHECFKCLLTFCKDVKQCHTEMSFLSRQHLVGKKRGETLHNKLKSKLVVLEFGRNAGASSSMMEEKNKLMEKILSQMHSGNFHPYVRSEVQTPEKDLDHALEMSCIPFEGSPHVVLRNRLGTTASDSVFFQTPDLVCASYGSGTSNEPKKQTRTSTQELQPVRAICTAQTKIAGLTSKNLLASSPITSIPAKDNNGLPSATLKRKLFAVDNALKESEGKNGENIREAQRKPQLEMPSLKATHRRSRSDLLDSVCLPNKWIQYEHIRGVDTGEGDKAPLAKPESAYNLSTLNLEKRGKILTKNDIAAYQYRDNDADARNHCTVENGPQITAPNTQIRRNEKKSSVGGFFSKIGRAVLKPRNTYSDGDQYTRPVKEHRKKMSAADKENSKEDSRMASNEKLAGGEFQRGTDGNGNRVSRFFQRGGLYRSSKMKKKNQKQERV